MERKVQQVRWTEKASNALEEVYTFHANKSELAAITVVGEIIEKGDNIIFPDQYEVGTFGSKDIRPLDSHI